MSKRTLETEKKPDVVKTFLPISLMQDWIISEGSKIIQAFLDMQTCKKKFILRWINTTPSKKRGFQKSSTEFQQLVIWTKTCL